jgi:pimeloyl-ACP methyl ester carboxylesterase
MNRVVVFVPGIMGSELKLGDRLIWPGGVSDLVFRYPYISSSPQVRPHGDELLSPDLTVGDVIRRVSVSPQYGSLIDTLNGCGFREDNRTLYPFPYDWRRSNSCSAALLADRIDSVLAEWQGKGEFEISLVAHSMGGLVSRCYLESDAYAKRPGFKFVKNLLCLATPHLGSPLALTASLGMERRLFLNGDKVYKLVNQTAFTSLYELLPPQGTPFVWNRKPNERLNPVDIYGSAAGSLCAFADPGRRLNLANLQAAHSFHGQLSLARRPDVRYFFFAGTRQPSATFSVLTLSGTDLEVQNREIDNGGDGTVPFWSAAVSGIQVAGVGGEHGTIYKDEELRRVLEALLGSRALLPARVPVPQLSVRDRVVDPGASFHVLVTFPSGVAQMNGEIRIEKLLDPQTGTYSPAVFVSRFDYRGALADHFSVILTAPNIYGVYRVAFHPQADAENMASDDLFVQAPVERPPAVESTV